MGKLFIPKSAWGFMLVAAASIASHAQVPPSGAPDKQQQPATASDLSAVLAALGRQQTTRRLGDGCWVRFYEEAHFRGRSITVVGPVDVARVNVAGSRLADWDSAVVGPQATVTTYAKQGFRSPFETIGPGRQVADLQQGVDGARDQVRSANVDCLT